MTPEKPKRSDGRSDGSDGRQPGSLLPGSSANPGGRPKLPDAFKAKGPKFLEAMVEIAEQPLHEKHFDAVKWCAERVYGKAMQGMEIETGATINEIIAKIAQGEPIG